jgi:hypothetical protein
LFIVDNDSFISADKGLANTRGWIFQERLLAPRTVFFGNDDVYWECGCFALSDLNPGGAVHFRDKVSIGGIRQQFHSQRYCYDDMASQRLWNSILQHYTSAKLTNPDDRLMALSGVAEYISNSVEDTYFAGLFRKFLIEGLCWIPMVSQIIPGSVGVYLTRKTAYRASSWSWAKLDCAIYAAYHYMSPFGRAILSEITSATMSSKSFHRP